MASPDVFDEPGLDDDDFRPGFKDGMGHKCGVFGVFGREDAAILTALGLHALQHRGQEACGIVTFDGKGGTFRSERHMGLVQSPGKFTRSRAGQPGFLSRIMTRDTALADGLLITKRQAIALARNAKTPEALARGLSARRMNAEIVPAGR